jgi:beta-lactamase regulating signal transducer with metallopeptidase domain
MMPIQVMVVPVWVERLGWMLVHSLWQLAIVAVLAAVLLRLLRIRSARMRYAVAVAMLALMAIGPAATWCFISVEPVQRVSSSRTDERSAAGQQVASVVQKPVTTEAGSVGFEDVRPVEVVAIPLAAKAEEMNASALTSKVDVDSASKTSASARHPDLRPASKASLFRESIEKIAQSIKPRLPILVGVWLLGVLICSIRPIWGLWIQWRLRHSGLQPVPESIQSTLNTLIQKLRLTRVVRIAESALVKVPLVVGYVHPMILLPASVITGLTSSQLEAVLAHELAHVRRHDWLINTLQVIAETLLFYHPAVWWLSSRIRHERELCCDDIALGLDVDKAVFARTLLTLEELRQKAMVPAMAATGGDLTARVRRLLITPTTTPSFGGGTIMGMLVVLMSLVLMVTSLTAANREESKVVSPAPDTKLSDENSSPKPDKRAVADPETQEDSQPQTNERRRTIEVLDENEQPVQNAQVRLQFISGEDGGGSFVGETMTASTNAVGIVEVSVPEDAGSVSIKIAADGFNEFSERQAAAGSSSIRLKRGRSIHVRAVDEAGNVLAKAVPLLAGHRVVGREFLPQKDGSFKSPSVDLKRRLMRVVSAQENGPFLFSELTDVEEAKPDAAGVLELVLKPGARITGRLDDSVPRPISEGYVQLMVAEGPGHQLRLPIRDENGRYNDESWVQPWTWEETASVQPDGTFAFESVPAGGVAQLHVVVDGYMSVNPSLETLLASIETPGATPQETATSLLSQIGHIEMWPTLIRLDRPSVDVLIKCRPTASCDFRILDPSGNPIPGAEMYFHPNGMFISGGGFQLEFNSLASSTLVEALLHDAPMKTEMSPGRTIHVPMSDVELKMHSWAESSFTRRKSDAEGRVKIRNLPAGLRQRYLVLKYGYRMPVSQLYHPGSSDDDRREGYVDLTAGETIESTIYLDREIPAAEREVIVIDDKGKPLAGVTISLLEMRVGLKDWQLWSVQRFGATQSAKSDKNGRVVLSVPSHVGNIAVERLRLSVNYDSEDDKPFLRVGDQYDHIWVGGGLVDVPLKADEGVVAIIRNPDSSRASKAVYGPVSQILATQTPEQLMNAMIKTPNLAILRQLLSTAKSKQPEPVELLDDGRFGGESKGVRVHLIPSGESLFALVGARVRPADGTRRDELDMSNLPECVFVFDSDGKPVAALGGEVGTTGAGDPENVEILCLGPEEDWFVRVTRFQDNGPLTYQSVYYRIGESVVPSLKYHHYANSNAWSKGPEKITRHGDLYFEFPDSQSDYADRTVGVTADGVAVNGIILWDGDKNRFFGAPAQAVDGRPLYKIDMEWSKDFSALNPKADQMVLSGGIREFDHWYGWNTVVPQGYEAIVRVSIPQVTGEPQIMEQKLAAGRHTIQFQTKPSDDEMATKLKLLYGDQQIQAADLPFKILDQKQAPAVVNVLDAQKSVRLVDRPLEGSEKTLTLEVLLNPLTETAK